MKKDLSVADKEKLAAVSVEEKLSERDILELMVPNGIHIRE